MVSICGTLNLRSSRIFWLYTTCTCLVPSSLHFFFGPPSIIFFVNISSIEHGTVECGSEHPVPATIKIRPGWEECDASDIECSHTSKLYVGRHYKGRSRQILWASFVDSGESNIIIDDGA
jgi:hypothetical protein